MANLTVKIRDHSREYSQVSIPVADYPGAETFSTPAAEAATLAGLIGALTLGSIVSVSVSQIADEGSDTAPASGEAQREKGFRFFFHENVNNRKGSITLPTADFGTYAVEGTDKLDKTDTDVAAMIAWLEANATIDGNAVVVDDVVLVGRNS